MFTLLLVLIFFSAHVASIDCNACAKKCSWSDISCPGKKAQCKAAAASFSLFSNLGKLGATSCAADGKLEDAKELLIWANVFPRSAFDGVSIRRCSMPGAGYTPSGSTVYVNRGLGDRGSVETLAHEMVHINQFRTFGYEGFGCRYIDYGCHPFKDSCAIEDPAYGFESTVPSKLASKCAPYTSQERSGFKKLCNEFAPLPSSGVARCSSLSCSKCVAAVGCGWCGTSSVSGSCLESRRGSSSSPSTCSSSKWHYSRCPAP